MEQLLPHGNGQVYSLWMSKLAPLKHSDFHPEARAAGSGGRGKIAANSLRSTFARGQTKIRLVGFQNRSRSNGGTNCSDHSQILSLTKHTEWN